MVFPPLRLSLHSSPQSQSVPTTNQRQSSTSLEKITRNKRRRPQWTPQDDEEILQQLHLSHILSSPFLSKNSFPAPLSFPNEVESSCQGADETEATNCQRTTEKISKQRAYEGASKSVSDLLHLPIDHYFARTNLYPKRFSFRYRLRRKMRVRQQRCYSARRKFQRSIEIHEYDCKISFYHLTMRRFVHKNSCKYNASLISVIFFHFLISLFINIMITNYLA